MQKMIYRRIAGVTVAAATVMAAMALFGERQPIDRYQSIIDRQMFGPLPPNFDPTRSPSEISAKDARAQEQELTKEQEQVKSAIHFSVINVTPAGDTAVGFTDNSEAKNPKHYYLKVGESRDGWTVKEADPLAASMTIAKGEIEVTLTIGGNSANGGTTKSAGPSNGASKGSVATGGRSNLLGGRTGGSAAGSRGLGSLRERRALREQQRAADAQAAAEEREKAAEKEAQREAERAAEKEQREKEREEQRAQLLQIQEELRKAREERDRKTDEEGEKKGEDSDREGNGET